MVKGVKPMTGKDLHPQIEEGTIRGFKDLCIRGKGVPKLTMSVPGVVLLHTKTSRDWLGWYLMGLGGAMAPLNLTKKTSVLGKRALRPGLFGDKRRNICPLWWGAGQKGPLDGSRTHGRNTSS